MEETVDLVTVKVFDNKLSGSLYIAEALLDLIHQHTKKEKETVLGLATGSSPLKVYEQLVHYFHESKLSFEHVISFNLDEYYPISADRPNSYHYYMQKYLFGESDISSDHVFIPDGTISESDIPAFCSDYEKKIEAFGGIDVQLLGIGANGHIGFNEPGSSLDSKTRLITLDEKTRRDAAKYFGGFDKTPQKAITMGISTILKAKKIYCMAWGEHKAEPVLKFLEGGMTDQWPVTFLQEHPNVELIIDKAAATLIKDHAKLTAN